MPSDKKEYRVIGLMSGTSFDGLDIALCIFSLSNSRWSFKIEKAETIKYTSYWTSFLKEAEKPEAKHSEVSLSYGKFLGEKVNEFIHAHSIINVDFIASHGHTILHEPEKKVTFQVGDGATIRRICNIPTICNFRQQDVLLGGQGAPLVPIGDFHLFKKFNVCVNLGGFANLSSKTNNTITAWDICPVNYVLNKLTNEIGFEFDDEGKIAFSNKVNAALLVQLNDLRYYKKSPPKSLAREWVMLEFWPILNKFNCTVEQKIATVTEHAAIQIANSIPRNTTTLFTGGGTFNSYLMGRIKFHNTTIEVSIPSKKIIEFKEALIFAFLGTLRMRNEVNVLASVTGAIKDHSAGDIFIK